MRISPLLFTSCMGISRNRTNVAMTRSAYQRRHFSGPWRYGFQFHLSEMYVYGVELETV